jgi:hypothetical protein
MIDDDVLTGAGNLEGGDPLSRSNRTFWVIATALALVCILMVVAIFANRPLKNAIAHTESDLNGALARAQRIRATSGTFAGADAASLGAVDDERRYVGPDEASEGPGTVSVYAATGVWAAAVEARPDACFFIKQVVGEGEDTTYGVAAGACTGRAALAAADDRW